MTADTLTTAQTKALRHMEMNGGKLYSGKDVIQGMSIQTSAHTLRALARMGKVRIEELIEGGVIAFRV